MAKRGVTQELIEEIRALPETKMLQDIQRVHAQGGDLEFRDPDGATPVSKSIKIEMGTSRSNIFARGFYLNKK